MLMWLPIQQYSLQPFKAALLSSLFKKWMCADEKAQKWALMSCSRSPNLGQQVDWRMRQLPRGTFNRTICPETCHYSYGLVEVTRVIRGLDTLFFSMAFSAFFPIIGKTFVRMILPSNAVYILWQEFEKDSLVSCRSWTTMHIHQ